MLRYKGYLDCIDDLLNLIKNDGDVENWALMKKLELEGKLTGSESNNQSTNSSPNKSITQQQQTDLADLQIPLDYDFSISHPTQHKFPPTMPILSVDHSNHSNTQPLNSKDRRHRTPNLTTAAKDSASDTSDATNSSEDESVIDDSAAKRKLQSLRTDKRMKH